MNRFLYFLSNSPGCNDDMLAARGLLPRFSGPGGTLQYAITPWRDGPAGSGVAVALGMEPALYKPADQLWADCGSYWLGCDALARPLPHELEREVGYDGHAVTMLDGNAWRVPLLRRWDVQRLEHVSALPKVLRPVKDADGKLRIRAVVAKAHENLDALAETIWQAFLGSMTWETELLFSTATSLLAENYRIGAEECGLLGLMDEATALAVVKASIDVPGLQAGADAMIADGLKFAEVFGDGE